MLNLWFKYINYIDFLDYSNETACHPSGSQRLSMVKSKEALMGENLKSY
jgi:hypothetical protein